MYHRYGEAGLKGGLGGMGGQGGEAYGSPFDIFEQFFGGQGELYSCPPLSYHLIWKMGVMCGGRFYASAVVWHCT